MKTVDENVKARIALKDFQPPFPVTPSCLVHIAERLRRAISGTTVNCDAMQHKLFALADDCLFSTCKLATRHLRRTNETPINGFDDADLLAFGIFHPPASAAAHKLMKTNALLSLLRNKKTPSSAEGESVEFVKIERFEPQTVLRHCSEPRKRCNAVYCVAVDGANLN